MNVKIRKYFDYDVDDVKGVDFSDFPSLAMSEFKDESDLNNIFDRDLNYKDPSYVTKMILAGKMSDKQPIFGDFVSVKDFQNSLNIIKTANAQFSMLPSKIRDRFHNNPAEMLAFCQDDKNYEEGVSLGLFEPHASSVSYENFQKASVEVGTPSNVQNADNSVGTGSEGTASV